MRKNLHKQWGTGEIIKHLRENRCMTQEELAEKIGMTQQAISLIETNQRARNNTIKRIFRALFTTPQEVIQTKREMNFDTQEDLSEQSGVSVRQISRIENGEGTRQGTLDRIMRCLGINGMIRVNNRTLEFA